VSPDEHVVVAVLNWNGIRHTIECVNSLLAQTHPRVSIYAVDNGSSCNEADQLREMFPHITVIANDDNIGFCSANNIVLRVAQESHADYVLVMNNDAIAPPDLVQALVLAARNLPDCGAISPVIVASDNELGKDHVWYAGANWSAAHGNFVYTYARADPAKILEAGPYATGHASGCCMLVPVRVIDKVGPMADRYFAFFDEPEWCHRMSLHGYRSYVLPTVRVVHKVSRSTAQPISVFLLTRNRLHWMRETLPLAVRLRSYGPLAKEAIWHLANSAGMPLASGHQYDRSYSQAVVLGTMAGATRRWGRWPPSIEKMASKNRRDAA
jgi:GT2 family glycosyltransferase